MTAHHNAPHDCVVEAQTPPDIARLAAHNPFRTAHTADQSTYATWQDDALRHVLAPEQSPAPLVEFVHDSFRALVLNQHFSCLLAKSAIKHNGYRFGMYPALGSPDATAALAHDLWLFVQEQPTIDSEFTTFVASFDGPVVPEERDFERMLWAQLQALHELDRQHHAWDPAVSSDPTDNDFSFSFAGRAYFVIGLHPASSRWTRRFAWPTLVFNAHYQFEQLRADGRYDRIKGAIRGRDQALQGAINPMLTDFGDRSEARQYSGRAVEDGWHCPFHSHAAPSADEGTIS